MSTADVADDACERWNRMSLPNCLQVLALEYSLHDDLGPLLGKDRGRAFERDKGAWLGQVQELTNCIGEGAFAPADAPTVFGPQPFWRLRWDVLATPDLIKKLGSLSGDTLDVFRAFRISKRQSRNNGSYIEFKQAKLLANFAHRDESESGIEWYDCVPLLKSGESCTNAIVQRGSSIEFEQWAVKSQITDKDFEQLSRLANACGGDAAAMNEIYLRAPPKVLPRSPSSFLV